MKRRENITTRRIINKKGFTLIEIMVTLVIVGILAGLSITSFRNTAARAKQAEAKIILASIRNSVDETISLYGGIPGYWQWFPVGGYQWWIPEKYRWMNLWVWVGGSWPTGSWQMIRYDKPTAVPYYEFFIISGSCPLEATYAKSKFERSIDRFLAAVLPKNLLASDPPDWEEWWNEWYTPYHREFWLIADPYMSKDNSLQKKDKVILTSTGKLFTVPYKDFPGRWWFYYLDD